MNKNSVAEKGIQELEEELKKINSETINEIELMKVTHVLNSKIRHTHRSARELLLKRDQYTGENLVVDDKEVSDKQKDRREKDNKQKLSNKTNRDVIDYNRGDVVFVISDRNKHKKEILTSLSKWKKTQWKL